MSLSGSVDAIRRLTQRLLDERHPVFSLQPEVVELAEHLAQAAQFSIDLEGDITASESRSDHGLALSPTMAAMCAQDVCRTVGFLRGIHQAIQDVAERLRQSGQPTPVRILYAGTGPLALLATPLMSVHAADELSFVMVDIHRPSIAAVRRIVERHQWQGFVEALVQADACNYLIPAERRPHILLSETMNVCLENEPQVNLFRHLHAQAPDAILIPQRVTIEAALVNPALEFKVHEVDQSAEDQAGAAQEWAQIRQQSRQYLGKVFELTAASIGTWPESETEYLPAACITLPQTMEARQQTPMLLTEVQIYGGHSLRPHESGLTVPRVLPWRQATGHGNVLQFRYRLGDCPGLQCNRVETISD